MYQVATENLACFSSENEDGGVYFAPELGVSIVNGVLNLHYAHGRYGYWTYKFRYQNGDFELIGYESSENRGPVVLREISANLSTKRMRVRENTHPGSDGNSEDKFTETWTTISLSRRITLKTVKDFDELDVAGLMVQSKRAP